MRIFVGVLWRGGLKRQWGGQNIRFLVISVAISSVPIAETKTNISLLCVVMKCLIGFPVILKRALEMPFDGIKPAFDRMFDLHFLPRFRWQLCENE